MHGSACGAWMGGLAVAGVLASPAAGQCLPELARFAGGDVGGSVVHALAVGELAGSQRLVIGGNFTAAGHLTNLRNLAQWSGEDWSTHANAGPQLGVVRGLAIFDDGAGQALYVATETSAVATAGGYVFKWDGATWSSLGVGLNGPALALHVYDVGAGPELYVGGNFSSAGGQPAARIAKWNGQSWSALGAGLSSASGFPVRAIYGHDDGSGPAVYVGGTFSSAGGVPVTGLARFRSGAWETIGELAAASGSPGAYSLRTFDDGTGAGLYVGGNFSSVAGTAASHIACWKGGMWSALGNGSQSPVEALEIYDEGSGSSLHAGGIFPSAGGTNVVSVGRWRNEAWEALGGSMPGNVRALAVFDEGRGPALFAAGQGQVAFVRKWKGQGWTLAGEGMGGLVGTIAAATVGGTPAVYFAGSFSTGGDAAGSILRKEGNAWASIAPAQQSSLAAVRTLRQFGPHLYAGGQYLNFQTGVGADQPLARWDGSAWESVGLSSSAIVWSSAEFEGRLIIGGNFWQAGSAHVAAFDGTAWHPMGAGIGSSGSTHVFALAVHDDGSGPALFAAADTAVHRWGGAQWVNIGTTGAGTVRALASYDSGSGPRLYAGGEFLYMSGVFARGVARWDGQSWSSTDFPGSVGPNQMVFRLAVFDDGNGPVLFAGGNYQTAALPPYLLRYDGEWSSIGSFSNSVHALTPIQDAMGSALYIGGQFTTINGQSAMRLARHGCPPPPPCYANCDGSTIPPVLNVADFGCFLQRFAAGEAYANCDGSTVPPVLNVADFGCFLQAFAGGCR